MHEILKQGRTTLSKYEIQEKRKKLVYELFMKIAKRRGKAYKEYIMDIRFAEESMRVAIKYSFLCKRMCQLMGRKHEVNNLDLWLSFVYPSAS